MATACNNAQRDDIQDFTKTIYKPEYAIGFEILGAENRESTIIKVLNPWQGASGVESELFISRNGEEAPEGFSGQIIKEKAQRVICLSSSHVGMLDIIGKVENVVAVSGMDFISNEYIIANKDKISDIGYSDNTNHELIVASKPDLVLMYGINGINSIEPKLRELGIPFIYIGEYMEEDPIGKVEWIVALAEATGCREKGIERFRAIPEEYNAVKKRLENAHGNNPTVMINTPYGDTWFMASSQSYIVRLIRDAGGNYVYEQNTGNMSLPVDMEEAMLLALKSDCWINVSPIASIPEFLDALPKFAEVPCVAKGEIYTNAGKLSPKGGNDFWESGVVNPQIVLRDLVKIFHPELVEEEFVYYKKLMD